MYSMVAANLNSQITSWKVIYTFCIALISSPSQILFGFFPHSWPRLSTVYKKIALLDSNDEFMSMIGKINLFYKLNSKEDCDISFMTQNQSDARYIENIQIPLS